MQAVKPLIFLCLCFSFQSFSKGKAGKGSAQKDTEAGFVFECSHCELKNISSVNKEKLKCFKTIYSEECRRIPIEDKKTCKDDLDALKLADTSAFLLQCVKETALSFQFVFELLWYGITASTSWLFDSDEDSSSAQNYIYLEFYKAYQTAKGSDLEKALKAAELIGKEAFNFIWSNIKNFLITEYKSFKCYNSRAQAQLACVFTAGLLVPVPGASFLNLVKTGVKGLKLAKQPKTKLNNLKKTIQISTVKKHIQSNFDPIKKNVLERSKKLTQAQRDQIKQFFSKVNREQFIKSISKQLSRVKEAALSKESIRSAVVSSLTVGSSHIIQLSQKSAFAVAEGVADTIAIEYIYKEVM